MVWLRFFGKVFNIVIFNFLFGFEGMELIYKKKLLEIEIILLV